MAVADAPLDLLTPLASILTGLSGGLVVALLNNRLAQKTLEHQTLWADLYDTLNRLSGESPALRAAAADRLCALAEYRRKGKTWTQALPFFRPVAKALPMAMMLDTSVTVSARMADSIRHLMEFARSEPVLLEYVQAELDRVRGLALRRVMANIAELGAINDQEELAVPPDQLALTFWNAGANWKAGPKDEQRQKWIAEVLNHEEYEVHKERQKTKRRLADKKDEFTTVGKLLGDFIHLHSAKLGFFDQLRDEAKAMRERSITEFVID